MSSSSLEECPIADADRVVDLALPRSDRPSGFMRRDLRAMLAEGAAASLMVGAGESYLPAFVLAMGLGQVAAGLITTVPLLIGAVLQLSTPYAVRQLRSHRRWAVLCAALQAASFVPLTIAALAGTIPTIAVFAVAAVYWGAGLATGAAWNTWVEPLVPCRIRATYFGRRTRLAQICVLIGFVVGGLSLQAGAAVDKPLWAFAGVFLLAAICRAVSAGLLRTQSQTVPIAQDHRHVSMREFFARFRREDGRLLMYLLSVQTAAQIAGPYFTSFMLGPLDFSYADYVTLIAVSFAAKALALPAFGRFAGRFGARRLLWLGGISIVPNAALWAVSNDFWFLVLVQILSGVSWAAYELAMLLLFFESIPRSERTSVVTTFNFANAIATASGSLLGGAFLAYGGKTPQTYLALFCLSSAARVLTLIGLARVTRTSESTSEVADTLAMPPDMQPAPSLRRAA